MIDRLNYYAKELPAEKPRLLPTDPASFPENGRISIEDLSVSYPSDPNSVILKGVRCEIQSGEKIGICGRTGSGKSTLISSLFRLVEARSGKIVVGGVDIASLGLHTLRKGIVIIPQNPVLFSGTIRSNIDSDASDDQIWEALEAVNLKTFVSQLEEKLDSPVESFGKNLSYGQRQLIYMAKAIIKKPKILVMDEATASIDQESDTQIQTTLRTLFADSTILSIAHRVGSILDFDKIMVLDDGRLIEFDTPQTLLDDSTTAFSQLVRASTTTSSQNTQ